MGASRDIQPLHLPLMLRGALNHVAQAHAPLTGLWGARVVHAAAIVDDIQLDLAGAYSQVKVEALAARDRERLLSVFERARADIEKGMLAALEARGL